jgi:uncharacterized protein YkwD
MAIRHRSWPVRIGLTAMVTSVVTAGLAMPAWADAAAPLRGAGSGRCLDVPAVSSTNGVKLALWDCNGGSNQAWAYDPASKEMRVYGNKCLDGQDHGVTRGTRAVIWDCTGGASQQWSLGSGGTILGVQSGLCLDAAGAGVANGTAILLWTCNGGNNQAWSTPATAEPAPTASSPTTADPATTAPTTTNPATTAPAPTTTTAPTATAAPAPGTTAPASTTTAPAPAPTTAPATSAPGAMSMMEQRAFDAVNAQRTANGCAALVVDASLQKAAHDYAAEMVATHNFSHTSITGLSPTDRAKAAGYTRGGIGENAMMGFKDDPDGAVNNPTYGWMSSPGHRANILNCAYTRTGMGYDPGNIDPAYADGSWIQDFG